MHAGLQHRVLIKLYERRKNYIQVLASEQHVSVKLGMESTL